MEQHSTGGYHCGDPTCHEPHAHAAGAPTTSEMPGKQWGETWADTIRREEKERRRYALLQAAAVLHGSGLDMDRSILRAIDMLEEIERLKK